MGRERTAGQLGWIALVVAACSGCFLEAPLLRSSTLKLDIESETALYLFKLFNRGRLAAGFQRVPWSASAAGLASRYSSELCQSEGGTVSEDGDGRSYIAKSGTLTALRSIVLARNADDVYRWLMDRPAVREVLQSESAIDTGIGITLHDLVAGRRRVCVTAVVRTVPGAELLTATAPSATSDAITAPGAGDAPAALGAGDAPAVPASGAAQERLASPGSLRSLPPSMLEGWRISGSRYIVPDDETKTAIQRSRKRKLVGSFKLCLTEDGRISKVELLKPTGFPAYDATLMQEMWRWRYRPYEVDGKQVPVCTRVTFIYAQR